MEGVFPFHCIFGFKGVIFSLVDKMRIPRKIKIWTILTLAILWSGYQFVDIYLAHSSRDGIFNSKTDIRISSKQLVSSFLTDSKKAEAIFVEKTVEVEGTLEKISTRNNRYTLFLRGSEENAFVMCDMSPNQVEPLRELQKGQTIRLKGVCKGFLMDAIFLNCIVLKD